MTYDFQNDLYELRDELTNQKTGLDLLNVCWNKSLRNIAGYNYIVGMADALFWAGKLTQIEYTDFVKSLGL